MTTSIENLVLSLVDRMEAGLPPWRAPWSSGCACPELPLRADGQPFQGSNAWLLAMAGALRGYSSPMWFTFKQALAIGHPVRKGESGSPAILYKTRQVDGEAEDGAEAARMIAYSKTYTVFNAEQLTDYPVVVAPQVDAVTRDAVKDAFLDAVPAAIVLGGSQAFYRPSTDTVHLPPPESFHDAEGFRGTKAHELAHWTGGQARLAREFGRRFGDKAYAFEELVAELASVMIGLRTGITPQAFDQHAAYLQHWSAHLKERPAVLLEASGHAARAVELLASFSQEEVRHAA